MSQFWVILGGIIALLLSNKIGVQYKLETFFLVIEEEKYFTFMFIEHIMTFDQADKIEEDGDKNLVCKL